MIDSSLLARNPKTLAIVGNGPVSQENAAVIDEADIVLRFNRATSCGAAGKRVDILMINRARVYMSKRINPVALHRAKEVWINDIEENGQVDWLFEHECKPKYLGFGPLEKARNHLERYAAGPDFLPTTGICAIAELLDIKPEAELRMFGFTHQGMHTHDLDAERDWINDLVKEGRLKKFDASGVPARRPFAEEAEFWLRLTEKRLKHYVQNKLIHSSAETKKRIYGE
ncbi:hypothetical protein ABVF61_14175 [Roseibium sp. HPY-6]|uniref:hypothetical protein n=1 Tax=Roseibium sp. HPY-6 TaxID=3229852 RepID=UPI00338EE664